MPECQSQTERLIKVFIFLLELPEEKKDVFQIEYMDLSNYTCWLNSL